MLSFLISNDIDVLLHEHHKVFLKLRLGHHDAVQWNSIGEA